MPLCSFGVVVVLRLDGTLVSCRGAAVADERRFLDPEAVFPFETAADTVAAMTGTTPGITDDQFVTGVGLLAGESVNAEVVWVVETAAVPRIDGAMFPDLSGDGGRILAEVLCNVPEGLSFVQTVFDVCPVRKCQVFMISRYYI